MRITRKPAYTEGPKIIEIPLDEIVVDDNLRSKYEKGDMAEMMASLKSSGQLQPISVKRRADGKFRIIFGNRRFAAASKLGWDSIQCVESEAVSAADEMVQHIVENLQRSDIPMSDAGRGYDILRQTMSITEIAVRIGKTASHVRDALSSFHRVPEKYRGRIRHGAGQSVKGGNIAPSLAKAVLNIARTTGGGSADKVLDDEKREKLWEYATQDGCTQASIRMIGKLMRENVPFERALEMSKDVRTVSIDLFFNIQTIEELEASQGKSIRQIVLNWLAVNPELKLLDLRKNSSFEK